MASMGYFEDEYLRLFVAKHSRRAPLINRFALIFGCKSESVNIALFFFRGYFVRAAALDRIFEKFFLKFGENLCQVRDRHYNVL